MLTAEQVYGMPPETDVDGVEASAPQARSPAGDPLEARRRAASATGPCCRLTAWTAGYAEAARSRCRYGRCPPMT